MMFRLLKYKSRTKPTPTRLFRTSQTFFKSNFSNTRLNAEKFLSNSTQLLTRPCEQLREYTISVVDSSYIIEKRKVLEETFIMAFKNADFNSHFSIKSPFEETLQLALDPSKKNMKYFIVLNKNQDIIGGCMGVNTVYETSDGDCGWFFVNPNLNKALRVKISNDLLPDFIVF